MIDQPGRVGQPFPPTIRSGRICIVSYLSPPPPPARHPRAIQVPLQVSLSDCALTRYCYLLCQAISKHDCGTWWCMLFKNRVY